MSAILSPSLVNAVEKQDHEPVAMKQCRKCKEFLPLTLFYKKADSKDGLINQCKSCKIICNREWKRANPDKVKAHKRQYKKTNKKQVGNERKRYYQKHKERILSRMEQERTGKEGYIKTMLATAKQRAKNATLEFNLDVEYLLSIATDHCPVDGTPFDWFRQLKQDKSLNLAIPSLDRVDSSKGYIKGNVKIIGFKWNSKKSNMNLQDLLLLVEYVRNATKSENSM